MSSITSQKGLKYHIKMFKKNIPLSAMALPGIIILILFKYLPMFGIVLAFKKYNISDGIFRSKFIGLKNFEYLFKTNEAWNITRTTLLYNLVFIILGVIIPVILAIVLTELTARKYSKFLQATYMIPYFLSWVVAGFMFYAFLSVDRGLINHVMVMLGLEPIQWFSDPKYWPYILTLLHIWKTTGYTSVMYTSSITSISNDYYEAAVLDGATKWQQIKYITLPFLSSMMIVLSILAVGRIFYADFGMFFNVTRNLGQLYPTTLVIDTYVYNALKNTGDIGMASSANFYQSFVGFALVLISNLIVRKIDKEQALF